MGASLRFPTERKAEPSTVACVSGKPVLEAQRRLFRLDLALPGRDFAREHAAAVPCLLRDSEGTLNNMISLHDMRNHQAWHVLVFLSLVRPVAALRSSADRLSTRCREARDSTSATLDEMSHFVDSQGAMFASGLLAMSSDGRAASAEAVRRAA